VELAHLKNQSSYSVESFEDVKSVRLCALNSIKNSSVQVGPKFQIPVQVNSKDFVALLDTGASISAIESAVLDLLGEDLIRRIPVSGLVTQTAVKGEMKPIHEKVEILVRINNVCSILTFYVIQGLSAPIILGSDWMMAENVIIDVKNQTIVMGNRENSMPLGDFPVVSQGQRKGSKMCLASRVIVPPRSMMKVTVQGEKDANGNAVLSPNKRTMSSKGIMLAYVYAEIVKGAASVWVMNLMKEPVHLPVNLGMFECNFLHDNAMISVLDGASSGKPYEVPIDDELCVKIGTDLTLCEQDKLLNLLKQYRTLFANDEVEMGKTNLVSHCIDTGGQTPIHQAPYRTSFVERKAMRQRVDELLSAGVVTPSCSPWSSPVVLVPKKDGKGFRFCVDYRKINQITKKDVYPLPRIEDALDNLSGASYFSMLDLLSGFYQIEVDANDREKTAFITPDGLYEFVRMPMGMCNSPATFQRLMDSVFMGMKWTMMLVYLDDVVVYGSTFEEMLRRLELVFQKLKEANLTVKASKCRFGERSLKYLGHVISSEGISVDSDKISSVVKFKIPSNVKEVRGFLGLCGYYRRFVRGFASFAAPLNKLLRKEEPFVWTEEQQAAFEKLKLLLISPPILAFPREDAETVVHTDASLIGLGATVSQIQDGKERVVAYGSRSLSRAEKNYSITELECLAIVFAVNKFRPYLHGRKFKVVTDHNALKWLCNVKDPNGRLARWALRLQSFDIIIEHRAGKIHSNVDSLSRNPVDPPESQVDTWALDLATVDIEKMQKEDKKLKFIIHALNDLKNDNLDANLSNNVKLSSLNDYSIQGDILYKANYKPDGRLWKLCVPKKLRKDLMENVHGDPSGGHLGSTRLYSMLCDKYDWPGMYRDCRRFVQSCKTCDLFRPRRGKKFGVMQIFEDATKPFQRIGIDYIGPFNLSDNRNRYVVVIIDHFSRYVEASAVPKATAEEAIKGLHEKVIYRHSCPYEVVCDRGSQFISGMMKEHAKTSRYKVKYTSPYHPQSNGITERANQTLKTIIKKFVSVAQTDWDLVLPSAVFSYNVSVHESTGYSPFYLVYNREARLPHDLELPTISDRAEESEASKAARAEKTMKQAQENSKNSVMKNKSYYDIHRKSVDFHPGEEVWRYHTVRKKGLTQAFLPQKTGPYEVVCKTGPVNYKIRLVCEGKKSRCIIVHVNDLRTVCSEFAETDSTECTLEKKKRVFKKKEKPRKSSCPQSWSDSDETSGPAKNSNQSGTKSSQSRKTSSSSHRTTVDQTVDDDVDEMEGKVDSRSSKSSSTSTGSRKFVSAQSNSKSSSSPIGKTNSSKTESQNEPVVVRRSNRCRRPPVRFMIDSE